MPLPELIDEPDDLRQLCRQLSGAEYIALDTEFIRERTYYPRLCLIQVATPTVVACVDNLALDVSPLHEIILDATITKVLHAARQDLEIFVQTTNQVPTPIFDTQVAADLCGLGDQEGFAAVANRLLGVSLDKSQARTDWSQRPLGDKQLRYAIDDVRYLVPIYQELCERLSERERLAWLQEDCQRLLAPELYTVAPETAWKRLPRLGALGPAQFHTARLLAQWREERAIRLDRPRGWVLRDDVLLRIAATMPKTGHALAQIKGMPRPLLNKQSGQLLQIIDSAGQCEEPLPEYPAPLTTEQRKRVSRMMDEVRRVAAEAGISAGTLATRRDVNSVVRGAENALPLRGWRKSVIGERLEEL